MTALVLALLGSLTAANPYSFAARYRNEASKLKCPPGTTLKWDDDRLTSRCEDAQGKQHGPQVDLCATTKDHGLPRRSYFWFNRDVRHGHYVWRRCDADAASDRYEEEGYYVAGERHGLVTWRDLKGRVHDTCTYVNGKVEGTCISHIPVDGGYEAAGFTTKSYYKAGCQYKEEHFDSTGRLFRSCELVGCKVELECTNYFAPTSTKPPVLRDLGTAEVRRAVLACYGYQPVKARKGYIGGLAYFTGHLVEARVAEQLVQRQSNGTFLVEVKVRVRRWGTVSRGMGDHEDPTWGSWRKMLVGFKPVRGGYAPLQCPWGRRP